MTRLRIALRAGEPAVQPQRFVAEARHQLELVRDEQHRAAAAAELGKLVEALVRERLVADGQHLVHEQHVGIDVDGDRESKAHVHARGVGLHRRVDEVLELGERHDLVEARGDLALRQAEHHAVDEDVLASGDLRVESGAQLDERRDAAVDRTDPEVGLPMPAIIFSIVLLPDPLRPTMPNVLPGRTSNDTPFSASNDSSGRRSRRGARTAARSSASRTASVARSGGRSFERREPRWRSSLTLPPPAYRAADRRRSSRTQEHDGDRHRTASERHALP